MTARIVVPFVGAVHPQTKARLTEHAPGHHPVRLSVGDEGAYTRLLADEWARPGDLTVIEHDIGIHGGVIAGFASCREPWCAYPYVAVIGFGAVAALGCVRFTQQLKTAEPDLFAAMSGTRWPVLADVVWGELDRRGYVPCVHQPDVDHYAPKEAGHAFERYEAATGDTKLRAACLARLEWMERETAGEGCANLAPLPPSPARRRRTPRRELARVIEALQLPGGVPVWEPIAAMMIDQMRAGDLSLTDAAIALFDSDAQPTWEQARQFVDAAVDALEPDLRLSPDLHLVNRDITVAEASARSLSSLSRRLLG